jgi:hypothetical protein
MFKKFGVNEGRMNRILLWANNRFSESDEMMGALAKAQEAVDFQEKLQAFREELGDKGFKATPFLIAEFDKQVKKFLSYHALLAGMYYFMYSASCLEKIFKDKQALKDAESRDKLTRMVVEDKNSIEGIIGKIWDDKQFTGMVSEFDAWLRKGGYAGNTLRACISFDSMLRVHAFKSGELYLDVIMKQNIVEMAKRFVR